jgi:hypothetical protein
MEIEEMFNELAVYTTYLMISRVSDFEISSPLPLIHEVGDSILRIFTFD